jgi:hypothetical protein
MPEIIDEPRPRLLRLADDDALGILRGFVWTQRRMESTHDDGHAATAILARDLIRAARGVRLDADRNQIGRLVERYPFHPVVMEADVDVRRRQPRDRRRRQRLHFPRSQVPLSTTPADAGVHQR